MNCPKGRAAARPDARESEAHWSKAEGKTAKCEDPMQVVSWNCEYPGDQTTKLDSLE